MGPALNGNTVVRHPDTQEVVTLHAGEPLPEWAVGQVGDHLLGGSPNKAPDPETPPATEPDTEPESAALSEPPRAGRGSGRDAWTAYAESLGIEVPDDAQRDDVIELVDQHNEK